MYWNYFDDQLFFSRKNEKNILSFQLWGLYVRWISLGFWSDIITLSWRKKSLFERYSIIVITRNRRTHPMQFPSLQYSGSKAFCHGAFVAIFFFQYCHRIEFWTVLFRVECVQRSLLWERTITSECWLKYMRTVCCLQLERAFHIYSSCIFKLLLFLLVY